MAVKITKRSVDAAVPGKRDLFHWDAEVKGFGLKVTPAGSKVYMLQYRMGGRDTPTRRYTIGKHGSPWTADEARDEAKQGQDCSPHAWATSAILDYLNIRHNLNFGATIICFGPGRADLVTHCSVPDFKCQFEAGQFHAWITVWDGKRTTLIDMTAYTLPDKAHKLAALDGLPTHVAPDLPKWLWGPTEHLLYPEPSMANAKPGQMWCRADRHLTKRRIADGNDVEVMLLRRVAVDLFKHPDADLPIIFASDMDKAGNVITRQMNR